MKIESEAVGQRFFFLQLASEIREKLNVFTLPPSNSTQQLENEERYCDRPYKVKSPLYVGEQTPRAKSGCGPFLAVFWLPEVGRCR